MNAETLLTGHWNEDGSYLHQRYPGFLTDSRIFRFCFLRDPLEVRLSLYYYNRERTDCNETAANLELEEFLLANTNYLSRQFPCTEDDFQKVLGRYHFIGLVDHLGEDLAALMQEYNRFLQRQPFHPMTERARCNLKNRPVEAVEHVNRSRPDKPTIPAPLQSKFKAVNTLDYELLRIARAQAKERHRIHEERAAE